MKDESYTMRVYGFDKWKFRIQFVVRKFWYLRSQADESVMVIDMQVICAVRNYGYLFRL